MSGFCEFCEGEGDAFGGVHTKDCPAAVKSFDALTQNERFTTQTRVLQRLTIELTRERNAVNEDIKMREASDQNGFYERGKSFGLSVALNRIQALEDKLATPYRGGRIKVGGFTVDSVVRLAQLWLAGFGATGEGYNAEYPFDGAIDDDPDLCGEATAAAESALPHLQKQFRDQLLSKPSLVAMRNAEERWRGRSMAPEPFEIRLEEMVRAALDALPTATEEAGS